MVCGNECADALHPAVWLVRVDGPREIVFSDSGHITYGESTRDMFGATTEGVRSNDGNTVNVVVNGGNLAVGGPPTFGFGWVGSLNKYVASDDGRVAIASLLLGVPGTHNSGVYSYGGVGLAEIAREGATISGGVQSVPIGFAVNDAGRVSFKDNTGALYAWNGVGLMVLATMGQTAPDGNGTLDLDGRGGLE